MPKGRFLDDTFEKLAEMGVSTQKQAVKAAQNLPQQTMNQVTGTNTSFEKTDSNDATYKAGYEKAKKEMKEKGNSTPLDFEKLEKQYKDQDKKKEQDLRQRLFNIIKEGEKEVLMKEKKGEQEKQQAMLQEEEEKKKKLEEQKKQQDQGGGLPSGKKRSSIFSPKKKSMEQHTENKPASSKN